MWILKSRNGDSVFYIKANSGNIIGRNLGDLSFPNDKSVSRKHATIYMDGSDNVTLEDHASKYGTYIDEGLQDQKRIESNVRIPIEHNSVVRFGLLGNEWTLTREVYKSCLSTIKECDLSSVREQLNELGVIISKEWCKDCTHLTMPSITLTLKVVMALAQSKPIVKPEFWTECLRCRNNNLPLPSANSYLPDINESSISQQANFHTDNKRSTLFSGKTFIFMSRQQIKNYEEIISSAGGQSKYLGSGITHGQLSAPQSIVIQHAVGYNSSQESQVLQGKIENITKYMISKKKRIIPEVEIGLAILYVSVEKYCNPSFNFASVIMQNNIIEPAEEKQVLAPETQETSSTPSLPSLPARFIDETLSSSIAKDGSSISSITPVSRAASKKRQASISPGNVEPLAKKSNVPEKLKPPQRHGEEENLFCFVQDDIKPSTSKQKPDKIELTFQSTKRKRPDVLCNEDNLFNFVPDTDKKIENTGATLSLPQSKETKKTESDVLNIGKNMKRKHDGSDTPDGKRINVKNNVTTNKTIKNNTLGEFKYTCQKHFTGLIKDETDVETLEVISKLKDLDILPAVVVINNDLVVKKDCSNNLESSNVSSDRDGKKNFKKFVKVRPRKTSNQVVSANMLVEYQPKTGNPVPEQFLADSSGEDEDDEFRSFTSFSRKQKVTRGRSRRL